MTNDWNEHGPAPELDLTELAALPTSSTSGIIRRSLAEEALEDDLWMISYRSRRSEGLRAVEQLPVLPPETLEAYRRLNAADAADESQSGRISRFGLAAAAVAGAFWALLVLANPWVSPSLRELVNTGLSVPAGERFLIVLMGGALLGIAARELARRSSPWVGVAIVTWAAFALSRYAPILVCFVVAARLLFTTHGKKASSSRIVVSLRNMFTSIDVVDTPSPATSVIRPIADEQRPSWIQSTPRTRWGAPVRTPHGAAWELARRAESYGIDIADVTSIDAVAAVLGAEAWLAATGASTFEQAASLGPVSLGSLASIYARAAGHGLDCLAPVPGEGAWPAQEHNLRVLLEDPMRWAIRQLGPDAASEALRIAASDMAANGGGDDRCTRAARWMHDAAASYASRR